MQQHLPLSISFQQRLSQAALVKLKYIRSCYSISFMLILFGCITESALLLTPSIASTSIPACVLLSYIGLITQLVLLIDMCLSYKACCRFLSDSIRNPDVSLNSQLKSFINFLTHIRYGDQSTRAVPFLQVRDAFWQTKAIPYSEFFQIIQFLGWTFFGSSAYVNLVVVNPNEATISKRILRTVMAYPYHAALTALITIGAVLIFVSAILIIPIVAYTYLRYSSHLDAFQSQIEESALAKEKNAFLNSNMESTIFSEASAKDSICSICLEQFPENMAVKVVKCCRSVYHDMCIKSWVETKPNCPTCRSQVCTDNLKATQQNLQQLQVISESTTSEIHRGAAVIQIPEEMTLRISIEPSDRTINIQTDGIENQMC